LIRKEPVKRTRTDKKPKLTIRKNTLQHGRMTQEVSIPLHLPKDKEGRSTKIQLRCCSLSPSYLESGLLKTRNVTNTKYCVNKNLEKE